MLSEMCLSFSWPRDATRTPQLGDLRFVGRRLVRGYLSTAVLGASATSPPGRIVGADIDSPATTRNNEGKFKLSLGAPIESKVQKLIYRARQCQATNVPTRY